MGKGEAWISNLGNWLNKILKLQYRILRRWRKELGMVAQSWYLNPWKVEQEFKIIANYIVKTKLAWVS